VVRSRWPVVATRGEGREKGGVADVVVIVVVVAAAAAAAAAATAAMFAEGNETGMRSLR